MGVMHAVLLQKWMLSFYKLHKLAYFIFLISGLLHFTFSTTEYGSLHCVMSLLRLCIGVDLICPVSVDPHFVKHNIIPTNKASFLFNFKYMCDEKSLWFFKKIKQMCLQMVSRFFLQQM